MAGAAFHSDDVEDDIDAWAAVHAEAAVAPPLAVRTPAKAAANDAAAPIGADDDDDRPHEEYFGEGGGDYDYYNDVGGQGQGGVFEEAAAAGGVAHWLDDRSGLVAAAAQPSATAAPSLADRVREAQRSFFTALGVDPSDGDAPPDDGTAYRETVARYMQAIVSAEGAFALDWSSSCHRPCPAPPPPPQRANVAAAKADVQDGVGALHMRVDEWQDRLRPGACSVHLQHACFCYTTTK